MDRLRLWYVCQRDILLILTITSKINLFQKAIIIPFSIPCSFLAGMNPVTAVIWYEMINKEFGEDNETNNLR